MMRMRIFNFDNLSSENYEETVDNVKLVLLTISYWVIHMFSILGELGWSSFRIKVGVQKL